MNFYKTIYSIFVLNEMVVLYLLVLCFVCEAFYYYRHCTIIQSINKQKYKQKRHGIEAIEEYEQALFHNEKSPLTINFHIYRERFNEHATWLNIYQILYQTNEIMIEIPKVRRRLLELVYRLCQKYNYELISVAEMEAYCEQNRCSTVMKCENNILTVNVMNKVYYRFFILELVLISARLLRTLYLWYRGWSSTRVYNSDGWLDFTYRIWDPTRETILFFHGAGIGSLPYVRMLEEMVMRYNVVYMDVPNTAGYQQIKLPEPYEVKKTIEELLERLKISSNGLYLMGHSAGTNIASALMNLHPSFRCNGLILVAPTFNYNCFTVCSYMIYEYNDYIRYCHQRLSSLYTYLRFRFISRSLENFQYVTQYANRDTFRIKNKTIPMLCVFGEEDELFQTHHEDQQIYSYVRENFPNVILEDSDHTSYIFDMTEFHIIMKEIDAFIEKNHQNSIDH